MIMTDGAKHNRLKAFLSERAALPDGTGRTCGADVPDLSYRRESLMLMRGALLMGTVAPSFKPARQSDAGYTEQKIT
jgi:hypothetical protein